MKSRNLQWALCGGLAMLSLTTSLWSEQRRDHEENREEQMYRLDGQRAQDMLRAYGALSVMLDKDHYIKVIFKNLGDSYKKYSLKSLSAQGTMLTIKLVHLDDNDKIKGMSLRASEIERLELEEIPW